MLSAILGFFGLVPKILDFGSTVTNAIANERLALINAKTAKEKADIQERIDQLQAIAAVQIAEAQPNANPLGAIFRFVAFGLPAGLAIWKLVVWDKVLGSFAGCSGDFGKLPGCEVFGTDKFDGNMWWVVLAAAGFYLLKNKQ